MALPKTSMTNWGIAIRGTYKVRLDGHWSDGGIDLYAVSDGAALVTPHRHRCRETVEATFPRARRPMAQAWYAEVKEQADGRAVLLLSGKTAFARAIPWAERCVGEEAELDATVDLRTHEGELLASGVVAEVARDECAVSFPYDAAAVAAAKTLPNRRFVSATKRWHAVARSPEDVAAIVAAVTAIAAALAR